VYGVLSGSDVVGVYVSVGADYVVGTEYRWYSVPGRSVANFSVPWSHYPVVGGQYSQLSKTGLAVVFAEGDTSDMSTGRILFTSSDDAIIGDVPEHAVTRFFVRKNRGLVARSLIGGSLISPPCIH